MGPFTEETLAHALRGGDLPPNTLLWRPGLSGWMPAQELALSEAPDAPVPSPAVSAGGSRLAPHSPVSTSPNSATVTDAPQPQTQSSTETLPASAKPAAVSPEVLKFAFTGTWTGYYRVWFTGFVLTVLTLGLYAPWAKVRNKRYLYAHTRLGNDGFDYRADPKRILVGHLTLGALIAFACASPVLHPRLPLVLLAVGVLLLPWLITQSLRFKARSTAWRGIRLRFAGSPLGFLASHVLGPLLSFVVFWPVTTALRRVWLINNLSFGATRFSFDVDLRAYYAIYLRSLPFFLPTGLCYLGIIAAAGLARADALYGSHADAPLWLILLAAFSPSVLPFTIPIALFGVDFLRARLFTAHWNGTTLGPHAVRAYMSAKELFQLRLVHTCATLFSFGLLWPWVKIHRHRFTLECLEIAPAGPLEDLAASTADTRRTGAFGEAASDYLNLEIGL